MGASTLHQSGPESSSIREARDDFMVHDVNNPL